MSRSTLTIFLLLLIGCFSVVGQPTLTGKVFDENGSGLAGATILEVGTSNGAVSDLEGNFSLQLLDTGTVKLTFIGYFDQSLPIRTDSTIEVRMILDSLTQLIVCPITCVIFQPLVTKTGINYGSLNNSIGIESQNFIYSIWRINLKLASDVKWRFIGEDPYFNIRIRRFDIYSRNNFSIGFRGEYKTFEDSDSRIKFYSVSPDFVINGYVFSTGYAKRANSPSESGKSDNGLNLEFQKYLFNHITFRVGGIYWWDDWQYNINLTAQIPKTRLLIGAGWEQIGDWQELDFSILYKLNF